MHMFGVVFFFNDTATAEFYTLSLHDALPICRRSPRPRESCSAWSRRRDRRAAAPGQRRLRARRAARRGGGGARRRPRGGRDRKSTRLNSSHANISYAVFCLKKKKNQTTRHVT